MKTLGDAAFGAIANQPRWTSALALSIALAELLFASSAIAQIAPPPREAPAGSAQEQTIEQPPALLRFVDAEYPAQALQDEREASVRLWVDIGPDGRVMATAVIEPVGFGFDEAAQRAVEQFLFSPARTAQGPIAVRVEYVYDFFLREAQEQTAEPGEVADPSAPLSIRGRLSELGSRTPAVGEAVLLVETGEVAVSDNEGVFEFYGVNAGRVTLQVPEGVYFETSVEVEVEQGTVADVTIQVKLDPDTQFSTLVRGQAARPDPQRTAISIEEAKKVPGTGGDPLRSIQNLPGVARAPGLAGILVVRGANPNDSLFRVDGQLLPQLYHFGGVYSVIPAEFIEDLAFYPGGFSAKYGDATGGLVELTLKETPLERWTGQVDVNVFHAAAFAQGPVWEGGTLSLGLRRSYIDAILPAVLPDDASVSFNTAPVYYDYQMKLEHRFNARNKMRLLVFGSDDQLRLLLKEPADGEPAVRGNIGNHSYFHLATVWWEHIFSDELKLMSSLAMGQQQIKFQVGDFLNLDLDLTRISWREDLIWKATPWLTFEMGLDGEGIPGRVDVSGPLPPTEGQVSPPVSSRETFSTDRRAYFGRLAVYSDAIAKPVDSLSVSVGVRYDAFFGDWQAHTISPRSSFRWQVGPTTAIKGGVGLYTRRPDFNLLDSTFGNPNLLPERALQTSLGVEQQIYEGLVVDVQGFYKKLDDLVRPAAVQTQGQLYDNGGEGRAWGLEALVRQNLGKFFWGWVSYTFLVAERKDDAERGWRPFDFDQTHVLTAVASFRLPWDLELSARFRYATGNPQTSVAGAFFDADAGVYTQIPGPINDERLPAFHQLDVRLDKTWFFDSWTLVAYLETWNTYNRANAEAWQYNYDFSQRQAMTGLPIIPSFGITGRF